MVGMVVVADHHQMLGTVVDHHQMEANNSMDKADLVDELVLNPLAAMIIPNATELSTQKYTSPL